MSSRSTLLLPLLLAGVLAQLDCSSVVGRPIGDADPDADVDAHADAGADADADADGDGDSGGSCDDACADEGSMRCDRNALDRCVRRPNGCLDWSFDTDCDEEGMICTEASPGEALCDCPPPCELGDRRCQGETIFECQPMGPCEGWMCAPLGACTGWVQIADCAALGLTCSDTSLSCLTGDGESCDDPFVLSVFPSSFGSSTFEGSYDDDLELTGDGCIRVPRAPEAVFEVQLEAGDILFMTERYDFEDGVNVAFNVLATCDEASDCLFAADAGETEGVTFTAPSAGRYFLIVEAVSRPDANYYITIDILQHESCGDGVDDDLDGAVDCGDSDCFGDPAFCWMETLCNDGFDNDADGFIDCDEPDCDMPASSCLEPSGHWELFGDGDPPDLEGHAITFTPDLITPRSDAGYEWSTSGGVTGFEVEPGAGDATTTLPARDDLFVEVPFSLLSGIDFFGNDYSSVFVSMNGYVTFGEGSFAWSASVDDLFALPGVSALRADLDPDAGGSVVVDEFVDRIAVTWQGVPAHGVAGTNDVQMVLTRGGVASITYLTVSAVDALVGLSNGPGTGPLPDESDFVTP